MLQNIGKVQAINVVLKLMIQRGVSIIIKEGTLTRTGATIIITDKSGRKNIYGSPYTIEKKENGVWKKLETIIDNYAFNLPAYYVDKNNKLEMDIDWEWLYGKLDDGEYRILKSTSTQGEEPSHYITVEFVIE